MSRQVIIDQVQAFLAAQNPADPQVDSRRLFHGRGQCFAGLEFICVDYFQPVILMTCFREPPAGFVEALSNGLQPLVQPGLFDTLVVQHRYQQGAPADVLFGELPGQPLANRQGLQFLLSLSSRQNTGFFLDMEPGRAWLAQHAHGKRILNLFAYTCAFSVVAVAAGASRVVNVDMSRSALETGRRNHQVNDLPGERSEFMTENILKSWGRIRRKGPYDLVIIDPPSYQPGSFVALKDYVRVIRRIPELMPDGGLVLACLNAPEVGTAFLESAFAEACPGSELITRLEPSADFPDVDAEQQLKLLVFQYQPLPISSAADEPELSAPLLQ
ncbi:class I SAM-dependent methyltransferase [Cellvibrio polysaccharolyticus]|uniref:Methyltransferase n=1 Tax=Cellvibrio polysaccharolyticus TaxID=2082724 RepID=A0A928YTK1_9GAMM|nr:class I SAM-dependent methyltransferase [Cellvibrio polysaccharolyticus]MBE8717104.1 methyltransferase [Cellvibrio polysaccharolyticus]